MSDLPPISIRINFKRVLYGLKLLAALTAVVVLGVLASHAYYARVLSKTESFLDLGLEMLAVESIDSSREHFVDSGLGCHVLLTSYGRARMRDRLKWVIEACRYNNIVTAEMIEAGAEVDLMDGNPSAAFQHFLAAMNDYKSPTAALSAINILKSQHQDADALKLTERADDLFPNDKRVAVLALRLFLEAKRLDDVRRLAARLQPLALQSGDAQLKKLVATGLIAGGDKAAGQKLLDSIDGDGHR